MVLQRLILPGFIDKERSLGNDGERSRRMKRSGTHATASMINIPYQIIVPESSPRGFHPGFFVQAGTQVGKPFGRLPGRGVPPGRRNDGEVGATRELPRAHRC